MQKNIHFIGIGGIGLSSLARHFFYKGNKVTGSDLASCCDLKELGIEVSRGHSKDNISTKTDLVIYSNAILKNNPELQRSYQLGIKVQSYPEALGDITKEYHTIAVSGTHGKGTTAAMLALVMIEAGLDPTIIIGVKLEELGNTNYRQGKSKYLLIEADEYKAALLNYFPKITVITNIEEDHLDYYRDIDHILQVFSEHITQNLKQGILVINEDDENSPKLLEENIDAKVIKYGMKNEAVKRLKLSIPGEHNVYNALASFSAARVLGIKEDIIYSALKSFKGAKRRFEKKEVKLKNGLSVKIINDYAHHPTEVEATLLAVKEQYPKKKIVALFQPHQYERTYRLFPLFISKLSNFPVDQFLVCDIYTVPGRESDEIKGKVSARKLSEEMKGSTYVGNLKEAESYLLRVLQGNEIVVIMGAGDVENLIKCISD